MNDFGMQKHWSADELQEMNRHLEILYNKLYVIDTYWPKDKEDLKRAIEGYARHIPDNHRLNIKSANVPSDGEIELYGLQEIIESIDDVVKFLTQREGRLFRIDDVVELTDLIDSRLGVTDWDLSRREIQEVIEETIFPDIEDIADIIKNKMSMDTTPTMRQFN